MQIINRPRPWLRVWHFVTVLQAYCALLQSFAHIGAEFEFDESILPSLETFVCKWYGHSLTDIKQARYRAFCLNQSMHGIPPTLDALRQHCKRTAYQVCIYRRAMQQYINPPSPIGYGWKVVPIKMGSCRLLGWLNHHTRLACCPKLSASVKLDVLVQDARAGRQTALVQLVANVRAAKTVQKKVMTLKMLYRTAKMSYKGATNLLVLKLMDCWPDSFYSK